MNFNIFKQIRSFFLIFFSVLITPFCSGQETDFFGMNQNGSEVIKEIYGESHALIIGISKYHGGWGNLPGVKDDVFAVKDALEFQGFEVAIVEDATKTKIDHEISSFISQKGQNENNRIIIYFAGHGHTIKTSYGEELGYIVPSDAPNPNIAQSEFQAKAIEMADFEKYAKRIQSKHALFLFDACFSGSLFALTRAAPEIIGYKTSLPVRQFITSGSANETVPDESIFRKQFVRALTTTEADANGDGFLTGSELGDFLQTTVVNYSYNAQHPQYGKIRNPNLDKGDFVFYTGLPLGGHFYASAPTPQMLDEDELRRSNVAKKIKITETGKVSESTSTLHAISIEWVELPPGSFTMGSGMHENGRMLNETEHMVSLKSFKISKYPVTFEQYDAFCEITGRPKPDDQGWGRGKRPVINVSWDDARDFAEWMGYRLPREAEWEYASRAGRQTTYNTGMDINAQQANYNERLPFNKKGLFRKQTLPIGTFAPNSWGIHDMHGNVAEWCEDWYQDYQAKEKGIPTSKDATPYKVIRGGSWNSSKTSIRNASRDRHLPSERENTIGFRLAADL